MKYLKPVRQVHKAFYQPMLILQYFRIVQKIYLDLLNSFVTNYETANVKFL